MLNPALLILSLCGSCTHAKTIKSAKGSLFLLCQLSKTDPRFSKYPVLPVLECTGYQPAPPPDSPAGA